MKTLFIGIILVVLSLFAVQAHSFRFNPWQNSVKVLSPVNGRIEIPLSEINDGKAHHFKVKADDGVMVTFFTLKSRDGVIRAAIDACDVCYKAGKGYAQSGDFMVCLNCGQKFASNKINVIKGGCNPAPLDRKIEGDNLVINIKDINTNSWYCSYKS
ncbi:MAG: DUF2318 domain-containing protein [Desulfobulbaceae bacterium]|uniref:DUF2318 domain-containing protein n=1 Tax=Candidatus Desulfobia pelagia TaxID=2841692 RepID=A0A8J6NET6_9BACT|nr:DUF2318 domain-containing protein [Candidatus Desulfobia pelagia]